MRGKQNIAKFTKFLLNYGCEIVPTTNDYELLRFKGSETGVIYKSGKVSNPYTTRAIYCYSNNTKWDGGPISTKRKGSYAPQKKAILKRDGKACWLCGVLMGEDITLEHLIALSAGGPNILSNMVLCHEDCNNELGTMPLYKKVNLAIKKRVELCTSKN